MSPNADQSIDIPERYEDVTADWLTQALRAGGVLGEQTVISFQVEPISADRGRMSSLARFSVEYDGFSEGLPRSIFGKFVSRISANRERAEQRNIFRTEIALYQNIGNEIPMNMPRMYFGGAREGSDVAVLLLEDINGYSKAGLPMAEEWSLSEPQAGLALSDLAKMHARWWEDPTLAQQNWLLSFNSERLRNSYKAYEEAWPKLRDSLEHSLEPEQVRIYDGLNDYLPTVLSELDKMPVTLCHGDFHVGNLMWDTLGTPETVWAVDWQVSARGPIVNDVSFLLGMGVPNSDLRLVRDVYLPEYHTALLNAGVAQYEFDQFLSDYRYGLLNQLQHVVTALAVLDLARDDSSDLVRLIIGRLANAAADAGCGELIS